MVGIGAAVTVIAVAVIGVAAGLGATAMQAKASVQVAEINAQATVKAAHEAAHAQIESAKADAGARMYESHTALEQDREYLKQEKWAMIREDTQEDFYKQTKIEVDSIDFYYGGQGAWGIGSEKPYDYGEGQTTHA